MSSLQHFQNDFLKGKIIRKQGPEITAKFVQIPRVPAALISFGCVCVYTTCTSGKASQTTNCMYKPEQYTIFCL